MPVVVITGVSRGIGKAMVRQFVSQGCTVCGCARSQKQIDGLREEFGGPHRFDEVDVKSDDSVRQWAESVISQCGPPDFLINNAALMNDLAPLWQVTAEEFDRLTAVNINGTANVIRSFVPAMTERQSGIIVNLSSGWGRSVSPDVAPYCATKWAIEGLSRALAEDLPTGMAAVPLNPGIINTDMLQTCFGEDASSYRTPDEWAEKAVPYILGITPADNGQPLTAPGR